MSRKNIALNHLKNLTDDELEVLYTEMSEGIERVHLLEELARRGIEWAANLAQIEREQYQADQLVRRHFTDLPGVAEGVLDSDEALEEAVALDKDSPEVKSVIQIIPPGMQFYDVPFYPYENSDRDS